MTGCSSFPPLAVGYTFPMTVSVSTPGWSAPVKVAPSAAVNQPALLVPPGSAPDASDTAQVAGKGTVPVVAAPVNAPVLAVPVKGAAVAP
jgi:hypothetical protein